MSGRSVVTDDLVHLFTPVVNSVQYNVLYYIAMRGHSKNLR